MKLRKAKLGLLHHCPSPPEVATPTAVEADSATTAISRFMLRSPAARLESSERHSIDSSRRAPRAPLHQRTSFAGAWHRDSNRVNASGLLLCAQTEHSTGVCLLKTSSGPNTAVSGVPGAPPRTAVPPKNPIRARNRGFGRTRMHLQLTLPQPGIRSKLIAYIEVKALGADYGLGTSDRRFYSGVIS